MRRLFPAPVSLTQTLLCMWSDKEINVQDIFTHLRSPDIEFQENCTLCVSFYLCPESTFKRRTLERENVAYKRANVAWERTNVANVACEFWFSPQIAVRIPYFASAQILPRGRNSKRIKPDRETRNNRGKTISLRGGCNGFNVKKRRRARDRQTDRQIDRKCLKISKTRGCFCERPTWTQKSMVFAQLPLRSFHLFSPLHLSLLLPFASPRGRRNASLIKASVDTGENAIWIIIERLCMQRRKVADSPLFVKYNFEGSLTGGSLDFLRDASCFASSRIDFARRLFNFRV